MLPACPESSACATISHNCSHFNATSISSGLIATVLFIARTNPLSTEPRCPSAYPEAATCPTPPTCMRRQFAESSHHFFRHDLRRPLVSVFSCCRIAGLFDSCIVPTLITARPYPSCIYLLHSKSTNRSHQRTDDDT